MISAQVFLVLATLLVLGVAPLAVVLSGRDVSRVDFDALLELPTEVVLVLRLASLSVVLLALVRMLTVLGAQPPRAQTPILQPGSEGDAMAHARAPALLMAAFFGYFLSHYGLNAVLGSVGGTVSQQPMYAALLVAAVFLSAGAIIGRVLVLAWTLLALSLLAGLGFLLFDPGLVRELGSGRLPGIEFRFYGLSSNPNSLATLATVLLVLGLGLGQALPVLLRAAGAGIALTVLLLAQSQTGWMVTLLSLAAMALCARFWQWSDPRVLGLTSIGLALAGLAATASVSFMTHGLALTDVATGERYREIMSLTGRRAIWHAAWEAWEDAPLFGYGPRIWDAAHRAQLGMPFAFHAHNQLMQSLAQAGVFGVSTLIAYVLALAWWVLRLPTVWRPIGAGLGTLLAARGVTEVPFALGTVFADEFVAHFLLLMLLACAHRVQLAGRSP